MLFVCTGNTCRSPIAAALFPRLVREGCWVESAGLRASRGAPASTGAQTALREIGLDLSRHRSKPLDDLPVEQFDLVLAMTAEQRTLILERAPGLRGRVFCLAEMAGEIEDIADPYGASETAYRQTVQRIGELMTKGKAKILELMTKF